MYHIIFYLLFLSNLFHSQEYSREVVITVDTVKVLCNWDIIKYPTCSNTCSSDCETTKNRSKTTLSLFTISRSISTKQPLKKA